MQNTEKIYFSLFQFKGEDMKKIKDFFKDKIIGISSYSTKIITRLYKKNDFIDFLWLDRLMNYFPVWRKIFFFLPIHVFFFYIKQMISEYESDKAIINEFEKELIKVFIDSDDKKKMFIEKMIFYTTFVTNNLCKELLRFSIDTTNINICYIITMDITWITFSTQKGMYNGFYLDRKKSLDRLSDFIRVPQKKKESTNDVLCIITYMIFRDDTNSSQRVLDLLLDNLQHRFSQIYVISSETFSLPNVYKDNMFLVKKTNSGICEHKLSKKSYSNIKFLFSNGSNYLCLCQDFVNKIYDCNPSVILDISDECSPASKIYSKDFRTYYLPLRSVLSSQHFYSIFCKKELLKGKLLSDSIKALDIRITEWDIPEFIMPVFKRINRDSLGIKNDCFVIVSAGSNGNLFSKEMIDIVCNILASHNDIIWYFIGGGYPDYLVKEYKRLIRLGLIKHHDYDNNLGGILSCCNILLRPNQTGGSGCTSIAALAGLPIVMTDYLCDPMRWLGRDFSKCKTTNDIKEEILKLYDDKVYYIRQSERVSRLVKKALNYDCLFSQLERILKDDYL